MKLVPFLTKSEVRKAASSPTVATEYLADLLVSHETLRRLAAQAGEWLPWHNGFCLSCGMPKGSTHMAQCQLEELVADMQRAQR